MDLFKTQFNRISQQLSGLSASQRMLTACLVAIMVMTVVWWSRYAAEPEMEPVLNQSLSDDDIAQITNQLDAKQIPHSVVGDKVMVPADRKIEVLAELGYARALPHNTKSGIDDMIKNISPFTSPQAADAMYLEAKQQTLQAIIGRFPGVSEAVVVIDPTSERSLSGASVQPTATVYVTTRGDGQAPGKRVAEAAADVVCGGAEAGLERSHVTVVIDGSNFLLQNRSPDGADPAQDVVGIQKQHEDFYRDKILAHFSFIRGLMVSVTVKTVTSTKDTEIVKYDPKPVSTPIHEDSLDTSSGGTGGGGGEPGSVSNVPMDLTTSGTSSQPGTTSNDTKTDYQVYDGREEDKLHQGPGDATVLAASVRVPRSYFINALRNQNGGKDPDDTTLSAFITSELEQIRKDVKACTMVPTDDAVTVGTYSDPIPLLSASAPVAAASPMSSVIGGHGKEIGVGALAAISLLMVTMMVRKSGTSAVAAVEHAPREAAHLSTGDEVAGEAGDGKTLLDAVELDDETIKTQQMLQQVQELVSDNPDTAANLVKRWLNRA